jgi:hypothetical protein
MKTPPLLLGAALVFWGWSSDMLWVSIVMAAILEGSRILKTRWDLSLSDFSRIADVTSLMLFGLVIYLYVTEGVLGILYILLQWLPALFFLLLLAQEYSTQGCINARSLFWTLRRRQPRYYTPEPQFVNLTYPYVVMCLVAASSMNVRSQIFYALFLLLTIWALWSIRVGHYPVLLWISVILIALYIGYTGQQMLRRLQYALENSSTLVRLITGMRPPEVDPYETSTAIGSIGTIKLSNRVIFRVKAETPQPGPFLLREATYNAYQHSRWFAAYDEFAGLEPESDRTSWVLRPEEVLQAENMQPASSLPTSSSTNALSRITVSSRLEEGKGILKLPTDTVRIDRLLAAIVAQNRFGVVKVEEGPNILTYTPIFGGRPIDSSPDETRDLELPVEDAAELRAIVAQHNLKGATDEQTVEAIADFFRQSFSYSLTLRRSQSRTPIINFLQDTRRGHCEYFATATVLLLRAAGVPARYAVGYSVARIEADRWTLVRGREAHAWTLVYLNGVWQNFDTTPPTWTSIEAQGASLFEWLSNLRASIEFTLAEWQQQGYILQFFTILGVLLIPVVVVLVWRWYRKKRKIRPPKQEEAVIEAEMPLPGEDSAFYAVIKHLQQTGIERRDGEPLSLWIQRLERHIPAQAQAGLFPLLHLHYRYRFDPDGLSAEEQAWFQSSVQDWLRHVAG